MSQKGHRATAAITVDTDNWDITTTDETCTSQGSITFTVPWSETCGFYQQAPDDYNFKIKLHLSLNNTGSITNSVVININESDMNFNPTNGTGDASGVFSKTINLPCGNYYTHSIEVTALTSSMFTTGNVGDSHTWNTGTSSYAWGTLQNNNNNIACSTSNISLSNVVTNPTCTGTGTLVSTVTNANPNYTWTVTNNNTGNVIYTISGGTPFQTFTLMPGNYTVLIVDSDGCSATATSTITSGTNFTVSSTTTTPSYCILPDGSATLTANGGQSPFTVVWEELTTNTILPYTGMTASPLPAGTFGYTVTDAAGCTFTDSLTVPNASLMGVSCAPATIGLDPSTIGGSDGMIQVSLQNTTGATYTNGASQNVVHPTVSVFNATTGTIVATDNTWLSWNDFYGQGTSSNWVLTGLTAGTYNIDIGYTPSVGSQAPDYNQDPITVPAVGECTMQCVVTLQDPGSTVTAGLGTISHESCDPFGNDGAVQIQASGGSTNAFHHWDFTLCTDAAMTIGCQTFTGTSTFGDNTTGALHNFTGLAAGTYYATVTPCFGVNGLTCLTPSAVLGPIVIPQDSGPTFSITPTHPTCAGGCDGSFAPTVSGGSPPYVYQYNHPSTGWTPPGGTNWGSFTTTGQCAANIQNEEFKVIDNNGCETTATVTLVDPPALDFTQPSPFPTISPATCGANDGSVTFYFATGGTITPPHTNYTYTLMNSSGATVQTLGPTGSFSSQFLNLPADSYTLSVHDSNSCEQQIAFTVQTATFSVAVSHSDESCQHPPVNDGTLQLVVSPYANVPVPNYTYLWTNAFTGAVIQNETIAGTTSTLLTGLAAGIYNYSVTDGNGCVVTGNQTILSDPDILENIVVTEGASNCPSGCGILLVGATQGDFPLYVEISDDGGTTWTRVSTAASSSAVSFSSITLALPGIQIDQNNYYKENTSTRFCFNMGSTYHVRTISQANGCASYEIAHTMSNIGYTPMSILEANTNPTCCACNNTSCNGQIEIVITGGVAIAQGVAGTLMSYDWTLTHDGTTIGTQSGASFTGGVAFTVSSQAGTPTNEDFDSILFTGLYPGTYVFSVTDDCGVTTSETYVLTDPRMYITNIVSSSPQCLYGCDDGTITVSATGGDSGTYQFSIDDGITWSPVSSTSSYTYTGVGPGTWKVWARDPSCGTQILFDPNDNVLTSSNGCYSDYINGLWPAGTNAQIIPVSDLNTQFTSLQNNSLPGSSDGAITFEILGGTAPYEVAVTTSSSPTACNLCTLQTGGTLTPGLNQYINVNGSNIPSSGIATLNANGTVTIDNLSVSLDFSGLALGAYYTIVVKDADGCFGCISQYIDNGTIGIIGIYGAEDCNCSCPPGYSLIDPPPTPPALPCAGTQNIAPTQTGYFNAASSIQQFGSANLTSVNYGSMGGRLYIPVGGSSTSFTAVSTSDTFTKTDLGTIPNFPGQFISAGSGTVLEIATDLGGFPQGYGNIFDTRLFDVGIWPQHPATSPALPTNEWIGVPVEINFGGPQECILGISADGDYKVTLDCGTFLTSEFSLGGGTQTIGVDILNLTEYAMIPIIIPEGRHTLTFWVKNNTTNASADQVAGIAFDLFQANLANGLSTTSVFVGASTQAQLDPYYILDVNGKKITSRDITNNSFDHEFLMGDTIGYKCSSDCLFMENGNITCLSDDTADCTLPINCPEYLSDLVECVGTLSNEVYTRMISGLLENKLDIREIWIVILTKYLIKNLNPCVTLQDLLSWAKFLEDICPDCENNFEGTREAPDPNAGTPFGGGSGINTYDF